MPDVDCTTIPLPVGETSEFLTSMVLFANDNILKAISLFIRLEVDVGIAWSASLPGCDKPVTFEDDILPVNEREVLRRDAREQTISNL